MSIRVESTTDTPEAVSAAQGDLAEVKETVETKVDAAKTSASEDESDETKDASDASQDDSDDESQEDTDENETQDDKPKKKRGGFKRRIDKLNARISEYERELARLREGSTQKAKEEPKAKSTDDGQPDPDDFESIAEYTRAVAKWTIDQETKTRQAEESKQKAQAEYETLVREHNKRLDKYAKENPALKESIQSALEVLGEDYALNPVLEKEMLLSEFSHLILEEFANDVDNLDRVNSLSDTQIAREIGKLEAKFSLSLTNKQQETKKITKTAPPLKTLGNKSTGASTKSPDEMDFDEYKKWRAANS